MKQSNTTELSRYSFNKIYQKNAPARPNNTTQSGFSEIFYRISGLCSTYFAASKGAKCKCKATHDQGANNIPRWSLRVPKWKHVPSQITLSSTTRKKQRLYLLGENNRFASICWLIIGFFMAYY